MEKIRIIIAEMLGTMILVTIGCGSIVQMLTLKTSFLNVNLSFGLGAMIGILISAPISGGHINPAVTGKLNKIKFLSRKDFYATFFGVLATSMAYSRNDIGLHSRRSFSKTMNRALPWDPLLPHFPFTSKPSYSAI